MQVAALIDKIYSIPDGMGGARRPIHAKVGVEMTSGRGLLECALLVVHVCPDADPCFGAHASYAAQAGPT
jgi:hypothetical protein